MGCWVDLEMTKTELKQNITKITQILQSENYEAGFELLKTLGLFFEPPKTFPTKDEVLVLLYTYDEETFLYWWISNSSEYSIDCDECGDTFTFAETIQVDPEVEKIRCCPDCAKERNKNSQ